MALIEFKNKPNTDTPINDKNLNHNFNELNNKIIQHTEDTNIDDIKETGNYEIFNAKGTLPTGFSTSDNNIFIQQFMRGTDYGRQILYDVRTSRWCSRELLNNVWNNWVEETGKQYELYSNSSGSNENITLNDNVSNYSSITIDFKDDNNIYNSITILNPNGKWIDLNVIQDNKSDGKIIIRAKNINISNNQIINGQFGVLEFLTNNVFNIYWNNNIYITKVTGYK